MHFRFRKEADELIKPRERQGSFYDADFICEQLIPKDSFYGKFREVVTPLISDKDFEDIYSTDNGRPDKQKLEELLWKKR